MPAQTLPDPRDILAVLLASPVAESGSDHPTYDVMVGGLLGSHLESHATQARTDPYGAAMEIASLANRTDLAMLEHSGSEVEDHGDHLVVRTPGNPTFWWGNFLLLPSAPADETAARAWVEVFERAFPDARHRTFGIDGTVGTVDDVAAFAELGMETEVSSVMTATSVREPPRPNSDITLRPLESDDDWSQQVELSMVGEELGYDREYCTARTAAERSLVDQGYGAWWGAYDGDVLLSSMGLFTASPGLARFQHVKTHPDARGRGLAGTLVHRVSRYGFEELDAQTLVMVADPDYLAIRIYRSVGFGETERQLQVTRKPPD